MYYLLEDNSIIKRKYLEHWEENGCLHDHYKIYGKIKKKSENVADLIEAGDLIKIEEFIPFLDKVKYFIKEVRDIRYLLNNLKIVAIYKLNEHGDYMKVWEIWEEE